MMKIDELKNIVINMGSLIGLPVNSNLYPLFLSSNKIFSDGSGIYINLDKYHYIVTERGQEIKHYFSHDLSDFLFTIFYDITFQMANNYELENRKNNEDFRRILFTKQIELMSKISQEYGEKCRKNIDKILEKYPYRDLS